MFAPEVRRWLKLLSLILPGEKPFLLGIKEVVKASAVTVVSLLHMRRNNDENILCLN